jgi:hypothetical protein
VYVSISINKEKKHIRLAGHAAAFLLRSLSIRLDHSKKRVQKKKKQKKRKKVNKKNDFQSDTTRAASPFFLSLPRPFLIGAVVDFYTKKNKKKPTRTGRWNTAGCPFDQYLPLFPVVLFLYIAPLCTLFPAIVGTFSHYYSTLYYC